ncbi:MAG: Argininosuccinate synthase [Candidatus Magasanikbacteria bacterium GW2011_GWD2_43_18]|uniref:Argininosuccinate synthase n=1 Tax=Candidatus Magasanikbacteria bacterium GW2011_GWE2_42_7 TaxID=1619052 RepID=A0A0G1DPQ9_9BACT|nr:MAG: Argininosuccinate synthase [Candidatus Magasanikbacteria bacterium GW2011_GWC2_42_27]KKS72811.1 MAG: Argininosuccinate synthase [Candidatus Magasanikbacteria bacterium GW2011_GWE2_42_7]KKT04023.1 MAG: Argininosuccinate synthase [Candidatus Magasanikbacteria bacterium GW2011_GWD2_43_18]KKT24929.1 MAG: Argininosuccinate synthase [Candidatus Magasanikbacteria bacterium GW2011_GWA2_43_9]HBB37944.1 argininosuccinate synthase [Candidatus Magasanikbacteria bacterium]
MNEQTTYTHIASYEPKSIDEVHRVVLLYSGGLDTSVMLKWIQDVYKAEVIAVCVDIGQLADDLDAIKQKALDLGAIKSIVVDAKDEFAEKYIARGIKANASYQGEYHLSTPIGRPLLAKIAVQIAEQEKADTIAHGCTGKGNDQVRIEGTIVTLNPDMKVIAPVREWGMGRDEEIEYAEKHGIPVNHSKKKPYSHDDNMWGVTSEGGEIENPELVPPLENILEITTLPRLAPDQEELVELEFVKGLPVALNGERMKLADLIITLNGVAGKHGVGFIHHIEDRIVGLKVRGLYEQPAAFTIIKAHKNLEKYVCTLRENKFKEIVDQEWAYLCYAGLWYEPLMKDLSGFIETLNEKVNGTVTLRLFKGHCDVVALKTPDALFDEKLATFNKNDLFNQNASPGFIELHTLQMKMAKQTKKNILFTVGGTESKEQLLSAMKELKELGCVLYATHHTSEFMDAHGIANHMVYKVSSDQRPNIGTLLRERRFDLIINIISPENNTEMKKTDGQVIRELAVEHNVPVVTDIEIAKNMVEQIRKTKHQ